MLKIPIFKILKRRATVYLIDSDSVRVRKYPELTGKRCSMQLWKKYMSSPDYKGNSLLGETR